MLNGKTLPASPTADPHRLTPVQESGSIWLKRDDLFEIHGLSGGKARACHLLTERSDRGIVAASARQSPQALIVARMARARGLPCRIHTPTGPSTPELDRAAGEGAERVAHYPGYNSVIVARAAADGLERGWTVIPFGMESAEAVDGAARQTANLPPAQRLLIPVGSGMTLAGVLVGIAAAGKRVPVCGVVVGANPERRLDRWAPRGWRTLARLVSSEMPYGTPAPIISFSGLDLDAYYEAKCLPFLKPGDCLWIVGKRP